MGLSFKEVIWYNESESVEESNCDKGSKGQKGIMKKVLLVLLVGLLSLVHFVCMAGVEGELQPVKDSPFTGARWIGGNALTLPDADFGAAQWIASPESNKVATFETAFTLAAKPTVADLVVAAQDEFYVEINGLKRWGEAARDLAPTGAFHDSRYAKFVDAAPALKAGVNTVRLTAKASGKKCPAAIMSIRLAGGRSIVTDGSWKGAQALGGPRDVPWGKTMIFRREVNSPAFEKPFTLKGSIKKATLAITGLGFYEASINDSRVGEKRLDPIPSNYDKRVYYSTYDVTALLKEGENKLKVLLGHGWWDVRSVATWNWDMAPWRNPPQLLARLEVEFVDGTSTAVVSDSTWRQIESPIGFDCIREGEVINARNRRAIDLSARNVYAQEVVAPKGRLIEEDIPPTIVKRVLPAQRIERVGDWWRVDFGEDIAGVMRMRFADSVSGRIVTFRYDERDGVTLDSPTPYDGGGAPLSSIYPRAIDCHFGWTTSHDVIPGGVFQCDRYVTRGEKGEVYEPRFTYDGFRYVFVKGLGREPRLDECEALVLQTDFADIGSFTCSDPTFNALVKAAERAYKANFVNGYPTDCPHREKNGWTADAALASEFAMYAYENTLAYSQWLEQVSESQRPDGIFAEIVPTSGWGYNALIDWDAVIAILPRTIWQYRADDKPLIAMYPTLTNYLEKVVIPNLKDGLYTRVRGDWLTAGTLPDNGIVGTCYFKYMAETAARTARLLNRPQEAVRYSALAEKARESFNKAYHKGNGFYGDARGRQTTQAMALEFGMVPSALRPLAERHLIAAVEAKDGHLDFGLHGMKWVPRSLSKAGRTDLAFKMFTKDTMPSPAVWLKRGGTSLWEDWGNGSSRNHVMFAEFVCWAYQYLAGIRLVDEEGANGFKKIVIDPKPIAELDWARAEIKLPQGTLAAGWERDAKGAVKLKVDIPTGVDAKINLGERTACVKGPFTSSFTLKRRNAQ